MVDNDAHMFPTFPTRAAEGNAKGVAADRVTYNAALAACRNASRWVEVPWRMNFLMFTTVAIMVTVIMIITKILYVQITLYIYIYIMCVYIYINTYLHIFIYIYILIC